jgi:hypothetical protein
MVSSRTFISLVVASFLSTGIAMAQAPTTPPPKPAQTAPVTPSASVTASATMDDVSKWTRKQWNAAKAKWVQEKDKWNGCTKQATAQKLAGRKSWQFLYDCMTKS